MSPDNVREWRWDEAFLVPGPKRKKKLLRHLISWHENRRSRLPLELAILSGISLVLFLVIGTWGIVLALILFLTRELVIGVLIELLVILILRQARIKEGR